MKKMPMIIMLVAPYFLFGLYMTENIQALSVGLIVFAIAMLFGALYAFFLPRVGCGGNQILFWCMLLKVCNIPVFLFVFIIAVGLFVVIIPVLPFLFLFDYFLLLSTSMYGVSGLLKCKKEGCLSAKAVAVSIVLQFLFCADVLSAIYCYAKSRKRPEQQ